MWQVGGELTAVLGGGRALLLQVAHPAVGAGVAEFSDYRENPYKRLIGTLDLYFRVVFGGPVEAVRAGADLRALHRRIKGVDVNGERYHALAPEPFAWVHATLTDSLIEAVSRFQRPLTGAERAQIYAEMLQVGGLYGLRARDLPADYAGFVAYREHMVRERLVVNPTLLEVLESLLRLPPPRFARPLAPVWPLLAAPPSQISRLVTLGMLPEALRAKLPVRWGPRHERALNVVQTGIRVSMARVPARWRLVPPAYAARRRAQP